MTLVAGVDLGKTSCRVPPRAATAEPPSAPPRSPALGGWRTPAVSMRPGPRSRPGWPPASSRLAADDAFDVLVVGAAGTRGRRRLGLRPLARPGCARELVLTSDAITSHAGAFGGGDGAMVAIGTGAVGIGLGPEGLVRVDGLGYWLGDDGGGAWIGRLALRHVLDARAGGPATVAARRGGGQVRRPRPAAVRRSRPATRWRPPPRRSSPTWLPRPRRATRSRCEVLDAAGAALAQTLAQRAALSGADRVDGGRRPGGVAAAARATARPPAGRTSSWVEPTGTLARRRRAAGRAARPAARGAGPAPATARCSGGGTRSTCWPPNRYAATSTTSTNARPSSWSTCSWPPRPPSPRPSRRRATASRRRSAWPSRRCSRWPADLRRRRDPRAARGPGRRRDPADLRHRPRPRRRGARRRRRGERPGGRGRRGQCRGRPGRPAAARPRARRRRGRHRGVGPDAVRPGGAAGRSRERGRHGRRRQQPGQPHRRRRGRRHRGADRPGGARRVDPDEGGHRAEGGPQRAVDRRHGAHGQELRRVDGRRPGLEPQAPAARRPHAPGSHRSLRYRRAARPSRPQTGAPKTALVALLAGVDVGSAARALDAAGGRARVAVPAGGWTERVDADRGGGVGDVGGRARHRRGRCRARGQQRDDGHRRHRSGALARGPAPGSARPAAPCGHHRRGDLPARPAHRRRRRRRGRRAWSRSSTGRRTWWCRRGRPSSTTSATAAATAPSSSASPRGSPSAPASRSSRTCGPATSPPAATARRSPARSTGCGWPGRADRARRSTSAASPTSRWSATRARP